jgi:hypothetical protein
MESQSFVGQNVNAKSSTTTGALKKWIQQFVEYVVKEFQQDDTKKNLQSHILLPLLHFVSREVYPYLLIVLGILIIILTLCIVICILIVLVFKKMATMTDIEVVSV